MKTLIIYLCALMLIPSMAMASDYHVLGMKNDGSTNQITVVFHIPILDENNEVGYSYRDAISESFGTSTYTAELIDLQNGVLIEHSETVQVEDSLTLVQKRTVIDNRFTALSSANGLDKLYRKRLNFYGLDRDVP